MVQFDLSPPMEVAIIYLVNRKFLNIIGLLFTSFCECVVFWVIDNLFHNFAVLSFRIIMRVKMMSNLNIPAEIIARLISVSAVNLTDGC